MKENKKNIIGYFAIIIMIIATYTFGLLTGLAVSKTEQNYDKYQPTLLNVQESLKPDKKEAFNPEEAIFISYYDSQTYLAIANTSSYIIFKNNIYIDYDSSGLTISIEPLVSNRLTNNSANIGFTKFAPNTTLNISPEDLRIPYSALEEIELSPILTIEGYSCILDFELLVVATSSSGFQDYYTYFTVLELDLTDFLSGALRVYEIDSTPLILSGFNSFYELGYYVRMNSTEDTEERLDNVWNIFERAIESVLNVLKIELLPNIPLYVVIVVPVLFALLVWFIKLSQS